MLRSIFYESFANKKALHKLQPKLLCSICNENIRCETKFNEYALQISKNGHKLLTLTSESKNCTYICGNCNSENQTTIQNLVRESATSFCNHCQNDKHKNDIESVNEVFAELKLGYKCIKYNNNKKIEVRIHNS